MECNPICEETGKMLIAISSYRIPLGLLLGYIIAIGMGQFFVSRVRSIKNSEDVFGNEEINTLWQKAIYVGKLTDSNAILGILEITIFYFSLIIHRPEGIVAWLSFKIVAKWETWTHIIELPDKIMDKDGNEINPIKYLGARNRWATTVLQRFLIGTVGNIVAAFIGFGAFCIIRCL